MTRENGRVSSDNGGPGSVEVHLDPDTTLVRLIGEIDFALSDALDAARESVQARGVGVQIDAYQVTFLDSIGVGFIARLAGALRTQGRALTIVGASRSLRETLVLSGISSLLSGPGFDGP